MIGDGWGMSPFEARLLMLPHGLSAWKSAGKAGKGGESECELMSRRSGGNGIQEKGFGAFRVLDLLPMVQPDNALTEEVIRAV